MKRHHSLATDRHICQGNKSGRCSRFGVSTYHVVSIVLQTTCGSCVIHVSLFLCSGAVKFVRDNLQCLWWRSCCIEKTCCIAEQQRKNLYTSEQYDGGSNLPALLALCTLLHTTSMLSLQHCNQAAETHSTGLVPNASKRQRLQGERYPVAVSYLAFTARTSVSLPAQLSTIPLTLMSSCL